MGNGEDCFGFYDNCLLVCLFEFSAEFVVIAEIFLRNFVWCIFRKNMKMRNIVFALFGLVFFFAEGYGKDVVLCVL